VANGSAQKSLITIQCCISYLLVCELVQKFFIVIVLRVRGSHLENSHRGGASKKWLLVVIIIAGPQSAREFKSGRGA
jgi:hypothetical protein